MKIEIDKYAGFCFGVTKAISAAEQLNSGKQEISCLGQIVHNAKEEERLVDLGMKTIEHNQIRQVSGKKLLIRAHGEPPETYKLAKENKVSIIDATCPVVLKLQQRIKNKYIENTDNQIVIFGKKGHAEVNGLVGQTDGNAVVISSLEEADKIDIAKPVYLFSQTTSDFKEYQKIEEFLKHKSSITSNNSNNITVYQTICPTVKNRIPRLVEFCKNHEIILFVSDHKSSNGKMLFNVCIENNNKSHFVTGVESLEKKWFTQVNKIGISGATSTPLWLMENVKNKIEELYDNK